VKGVSQNRGPQRERILAGVKRKIESGAKSTSGAASFASWQASAVRESWYLIQYGYDNSSLPILVVWPRYGVGLEARCCR
jgi:hypothetical protein